MLLRKIPSTPPCYGDDDDAGMLVCGQIAQVKWYNHILWSNPHKKPTTKSRGRGGKGASVAVTAQGEGSFKF